MISGKAPPSERAGLKVGFLVFSFRPSCIFDNTGGGITKPRKANSQISDFLKVSLKTPEGH